MSREEMIDLVAAYFSGVDGENPDQIFSTLTDDCRFTVETHQVALVGKDEIRGMFDRLWSNHAAVRHDNFRYVADAGAGRIAAQFRVVNTFDNGDAVIKSNCNFFTVRGGLFDTVAVYMAGENTLDHPDE